MKRLEERYALSPEYRGGYEHGKADEREAVTAWLGAHAMRYFETMHTERGLYSVGLNVARMCKDIRSGEHLKNGGDR